MQKNAYTKRSERENLTYVLRFSYDGTSVLKFYKVKVLIGFLL
jgi:hypothetical protein